MCRPFFLPCLGAALISAIATLSNIFVLKETLPRIVEVRAATHAAKQRDEEKPLLEGDGKLDAPEPAGDTEGAPHVLSFLSGKLHAQTRGIGWLIGHACA